MILIRYDNLCAYEMKESDNAKKMYARTNEN